MISIFGRFIMEFGFLPFLLLIAVCAVAVFTGYDLSKEYKDWKAGKYDRNSEFGKWLESNWYGRKV